jgi:hypothetical protein
MKVRFSTIDEFLAELALEPALVEDKILRMTRVYESMRTAPLMHLYVVAGVVIRGKLVELRQFCGQVMEVAHELESNQRRLAQAEALLVRLRMEATRLGLQVRAGVFDNG